MMGERQRGSVYRKMKWILSTQGSIWLPNSFAPSLRISEVIKSYYVWPTLLSSSFITYKIIHIPEFISEAISIWLKLAERHGVEEARAPQWITHSSSDCSILVREQRWMEGGPGIVITFFYMGMLFLANIVDDLWIAFPLRKTEI